MSRNEDARRAILSSIRRSLAESAPHDVVHAQRHQPPTPGDRGRSLPVLSATPTPAAATAIDPVPIDRLGRFRARLEAVGGAFNHVRGAAEAAAAIEEILRRLGAARVAASDSSLARPLAEQACARTGAELLPEATAAQLFECDVGISAAQWGIAETGTLVLESQQERHRLVSLIPRVHIAVLRADRVCESLGEALHETRAGAAEGEVPSAAVTLVTGPSRTSDIELTLAIGVHGPQELHVIVLEPESRDDHASAVVAGEQPRTQDDRP